MFNSQPKQEESPSSKTPPLFPTCIPNPMPTGSAFILVLPLTPHFRSPCKVGSSLCPWLAQIFCASVCLPVVERWWVRHNQQSRELDLQTGSGCSFGNLWNWDPAHKLTRGFPGGSDGKESACNAGDLGSIPGSERSPGEGNGNPLQYSCLENSMYRRA